MMRRIGFVLTVAGHPSLAALPAAAQTPDLVLSFTETDSLPLTGDGPRDRAGPSWDPTPWWS